MTRFDLWSRWVAKSGRPILVGPWREEIGSETLYWLPFLAQWCHTYKIPPDRLIAISRGGASAWYGAGKQIELYDYWPPADLRLETLRGSMTTGSVKPTGVSPLEAALYKTLSARLGLRRYHVLHPSEMYAQIRDWGSDAMSLKDLMAHLRFTRIPTPHVPLSVSLPESFACVRFYQRHTWPFTEEVRDYCGQLVGNLAKHIPVVVIGSSLHHDDHMDLSFQGPNITNLMDAFPLRDNLALQSAVIAKSQFFVGTYGGTMQLAVRLGKPSAGFYLDFKGTAFGHKVLTEWLAMTQHLPIWIGTPAQADLVRNVVTVPLELPQPVASSSGVLG
jgi:hypothetical protein